MKITAHIKSLEYLTVKMCIAVHIKKQIWTKIKINYKLCYLFQIELVTVKWGS